MGDAGIEGRVRASFERQGFMKTLRAELLKVTPGEVWIGFGHHGGISQQHGFVHAAALTAIADNACGYAALTLMPEHSEVLTTEYKVNFLRPGAGERFIARGKVVKAGRRLTVCQGEVEAITGDRGKDCLVMLASMIGTDRR